MLEFSIDWKLKYKGINNDIASRPTFKLRLSSEWAIVFVLSRHLAGVVTLISIEIHRENTAGEFLVSGELIRQDYNSVSFHLNFSQCIKAGSSSVEIYSIKKYNEFYRQGDRICGHVIISEGNERDIDILANQQKTVFQINCLEELSKDLGRILVPESSLFADVTLKCGAASIPAHKVILSARSPVFAAIFANQTKESNTSEVNINDMDISILQGLVKYIYTGKTSDLNVSSAANLFIAADKYQLPDLQIACSSFLQDNVSPENVWRILILGGTHSESLKYFAVDYICNKWDTYSVLEDIQEWKDIRKESPELAMGILERMVKHKDKKLKIQ